MSDKTKLSSGRNRRDSTFTCRAPAAEHFFIADIHQLMIENDNLSVGADRVSDDLNLCRTRVLPQAQSRVVNTQHDSHH